jgi:PAS domain-containing protein
LSVATDAAELGIWTWQPEGDRIAWQNDMPYTILCLSRTDPPLTAARFAADFVHLEDLAAFNRAFNRAITDTVQNRARFFFQGRIHCPGGALRWIELSGKPMPEIQGQTLRVVGTLRDITERMQAQAALRESEEFGRSILRSSTDCIKVLDLEGNLLSMQNGQALLGIDDIQPFKQVVDRFLENCRGQTGGASVSRLGRGGPRGNVCRLLSHAAWH